jgi:hypothetical protein
MQACSSFPLAYTSAMTRLTLAALMFSLCLPTATIAQVRISLPVRRYHVQEEIRAKVENSSSPVTFCVEFGQTSPKGGEIESTPSLFWVQRRSNREWSTLMIGPDVGGFTAAVVLEVGESKEFPLRLNASGRMRPRLNYLRGAIPKLDCHAPQRDLKLITSAVFKIE